MLTLLILNADVPYVVEVDKANITESKEIVETLKVFCSIGKKLAEKTDGSGLPNYCTYLIKSSHVAMYLTYP